MPDGLDEGFTVGLEEAGGGGGAVGPVCPVGDLTGLGPFLAAGGFEGARDDAAGGGGRAVRRPLGAGEALLRLRAAWSEAGGGGGESTTPESPEEVGFGLRRLVGVWIAAGVSDPEEPGQANQMPAPAATSRVSPTMMGPPLS
ncbi:hypothetical protein [Sphaerisporangium flaviroseum]|uniref:hypothetical protein n=1 Tax=Sphaerisporangium flaviroseum TaxID=509199 RepID=UPI0031F159D0